MSEKLFGGKTLKEWRDYVDGMEAKRGLGDSGKAFSAIIDALEEANKETTTVERFLKMCKERLGNYYCDFTIGEAIPQLEINRKAMKDIEKALQSEPLDVTMNAEPDDMIERLQRNEKPFGLMDKDMQEAARKIGINDNFSYYHATDTDWRQCVGCKLFDNLFVYRLRADYKPKPEPEVEVVECEVYNSGDILCFKDKSEMETLLGCACDYPNFIGYKYADGGLRCMARKYVGDSSVAEVPTHVLFKKE